MQDFDVDLALQILKALLPLFGVAVALCGIMFAVDVIGKIRRNHRFIWDKPDWQHIVRTFLEADNSEEGKRKRKRMYLGDDGEIFPFDDVSVASDGSRTIPDEFPREVRQEADMRITFRIDDQDILAWLQTMPPGSWSQVIRLALHEHMKRGGGLWAPHITDPSEDIAEIKANLARLLERGIALQPLPTPENSDPSRVSDEVLEKRAERMKKASWAT